MPMKVSGAGRALGSLRNADKRFLAARADVAHMAGQILVRQSQNGILRGSKSGRIYHHPRKGTYRASAPGQYAANVTGRLLNSIDYNVTGGGGYMVFYSDELHAKFLEEGTSKMKARPNLGNAVRDTGQEVRMILGDVMFKKIVGK